MCVCVCVCVCVCEEEDEANTNSKTILQRNSHTATCQSVLLFWKVTNVM